MIFETIPVSQEFDSPVAGSVVRFMTVDEEIDAASRGLGAVLRRDQSPGAEQVQAAVEFVPVLRRLQRLVGGRVINSLW
jgi:hypothetical protein